MLTAISGTTSTKDAKAGQRSLDDRKPVSASKWQRTAACTKRRLSRLATEVCMYKLGHGCAVLGVTALFYKSSTMYAGSLTLLTPRQYRTVADVDLLYGTKCKCLGNVPTGRSKNN